MRQLRALGLCVVALLAIGGMSASAASATLLFLKTAKGGVAPSGTLAEFNGYIIPESPPQWEQCQYLSPFGTLTVTGTPKDKITFPSEAEIKTCKENGGQIATVHLVMTAIELTSKGKVTLKAKVKFERVGPCVYEITKIKGAFRVPGVVHGEIHGLIGKRNPKLSNITCAKTEKFGFVWVLFNRQESEIFESELRV